MYISIIQVGSIYACNRDIFDGIIVIMEALHLICTPVNAINLWFFQAQHVLAAFSSSHFHKVPVTYPD